MSINKIVQFRSKIIFCNFPSENIFSIVGQSISIFELFPDLCSPVGEKCIKTYVGFMWKVGLEKPVFNISNNYKIFPTQTICLE